MLVQPFILSIIVGVNSVSTGVADKGAFPTLRPERAYSRRSPRMSPSPQSIGQSYYRLSPDSWGGDIDSTCEMRSDIDRERRLGAISKDNNHRRINETIQIKI